MTWLPFAAAAIWLAATIVTLRLLIIWVRRAEEATARLKLAEGGVLVLRSPLRRIRDIKRDFDKPVPGTGDPGARPAPAADSADTTVTP